MSANSNVAGSMKEKRKRVDPADLAAKKEARTKHFHDRHSDLFKTLSNAEMVLDIRDRMPGSSAPVPGNSAPVAGNSAPMAGSPETPKSVAGSPETPESVAGSPETPESVAGSPKTPKSVAGPQKTPKSVAGPQKTPKSVAGPQKTPKSVAGANGAAAGPQDLVTKERARELRKQLKQLKAWLDSECMSRDQYKFARISIDQELRSAKRK